MKKLQVISIIFVLVVLVSGCNTLLDFGRKQFNFQILQGESVLDGISLAAGTIENLTAIVSPLTGIDFSTDPTTVSLKPPLIEGIRIEPNPIVIPASIYSTDFQLIVESNVPQMVNKKVTLEAVKGGVGRQVSFVLNIIPPLP